MSQAVLPVQVSATPHGHAVGTAAGPVSSSRSTSPGAGSTGFSPTTAQFARLHKLRPETREAIRKRVRELQAKIPTNQLTYEQLWHLYLEAADQVIEEIPGRINPLLPPEKILLFLVDLHNQLQN